MKAVKSQFEHHVVQAAVCFRLFLGFQNTPLVSLGPPHVHRPLGAASPDGTSSRYQPGPAAFFPASCWNGNKLLITKKVETPKFSLPHK